MLVVPEKVSKCIASFGITGLIRKDAASEISQVATPPVVPMELPSIVKCVKLALILAFQHGSSSSLL